MKERQYSKPIAQAINNYLSANKWHYTFDENHGLFKFDLFGTGGVAE